jgi:endoglucanase
MLLPRSPLTRMLKSSRLPALFSAGFVLFASSLVLPAQLINVDFNENDGVGWGGGGPNPGPTMTGAAVLGAVGDRWNGINVNGGNGISLVKADGSASPVSLTFTSGGGYDVNSFGGSTPFAGTAFDALMEDYLFNGGSLQDITLSGLTANSTYNLVLYSAANAAAAGRVSYFTVNGATRSSKWDGSSSSLIEGVNYVNFPCVLSDAGGNLVITYHGDGSTEGDVNGLQIKNAPFKVAMSYSNANASVTFTSQVGLSYQLQYKTNLTDSSWNIIGNYFPNSNVTESVSDVPRAGSRYYRVQVSSNLSNGLMLLHANGTNIVDANGITVQLRGLNLGGWFIMEKWMCPLDSGSLPDTYSVISKLDSRFGVATEQALIKSYQSNWISSVDLQNIASRGYNCVRVPVWWGNFYSITNITSSGWRADAFAELDWLVTNCAADGIYVVIDMHGVVGGQGTSDDTGQQNQNHYWTNSVDQGETAYMWKQIAAHYNGNTAVAGYDLINEPDGTTSTADVWPAYTNLYSTIRSVDPGHMIFVEGTFGSWNWSMLPDPGVYHWTNIVYSLHEYQWNATNAAGIEAGADNQVADFRSHLGWNVPEYLGEWNGLGFGASAYDYSTNAYSGAGMSWSMWAYKATAGLVPNGWGWYDPTYWPPTPNISTDSAATIANDWQQWRTATSFGVNAAVGL